MKYKTKAKQFAQQLVTDLGSYIDINVDLAETESGITKIPIMRREASWPEPNVMSSLAATKKGLVEILEVSAAKQKYGKEVKQESSNWYRQLYIRNNSKEDIYLMQGQMLVGGNQDRLIEKDVIVPAGKGVVTPVYCCEHGRGSRRGSGENLAYLRRMHAPMMESMEEEEAAGLEASFMSVDESPGVFACAAAAAPPRVKRGMSRGQSQVWSEISVETHEAEAQTSSDRLGELYAKEAEKDEKSNFNIYDNEIGSVFITNGREVSMEFFATPELWQEYSDVVIKSHKVGVKDKDTSGDSGLVATILDALKESKTEVLEGIGVGYNVNINGQEFNGSGLLYQTDGMVPVHISVVNSSDGDKSAHAPITRIEDRLRGLRPAQPAQPIMGGGVAVPVPGRQGYIYRPTRPQIYSTNGQRDLEVDDLISPEVPARKPVGEPLVMDRPESRRARWLNFRSRRE